MMLISLNLSAEVNISPSNLFDNNYTPFAGGNPKNIERNLFAPKNIKIQNNKQYKFGLNNTNYQNKNTSYLNNKNRYNIQTTSSYSSSPGITLRRANTQYKSNEGNIGATYSMTSAVNISSNTEVFSNDESITTPPQNPYEGSGAPSTFDGPIDDMIIPMLILIGLYLLKISPRRKF